MKVILSRQVILYILKFLIKKIEALGSVRNKTLEIYCQLLYKLGLVSKEWREYIVPKLTVNISWTLDTQTITQLEILKRLGIQSLPFYRCTLPCDSEYYQLVKDLLEKCEIKFTKYKIPSNECNQFIGSKVTQLQLDGTQEDMDKFWLDSKNHNQITSVYLGPNFMLNENINLESSLDGIKRCTPNVNSITIRSMVNSSLLSDFNQITVLDINGSNQEVINIIKNCHSLTSLNVYYQKEDTVPEAQVYQQLHENTTITSFFKYHLSLQPHVNDIINLLNNNSLIQKIALVYLDINGMENESDLKISNQTLTDLNVSVNSTKIPELDILKKWVGQSRVRYCSLKITPITDSTLLVLKNHCNNLETLSTQLNDEQVPLLFDCIPNIKELYLSKQSNPLDGAIVENLNSAYKNLDTLYLKSLTIQTFIDLLNSNLKLGKFTAIVEPENPYSFTTLALEISKNKTVNHLILFLNEMKESFQNYFNAILPIIEYNNYLSNLEIVPMSIKFSELSLESIENFKKAASNNDTLNYLKLIRIVENNPFANQFAKLAGEYLIHYHYFNHQNTYL
ncbi:cytidine deaminase-like protein [Tieghemostelium lacteum]|uniref:Cytidine deaminase-like protein n=1 Tax=Tieghemostelium lacteum TaxID=361077 RepID=A0A151Z763_TIELA|nr:cytidine deaminase-like protein [Tieghemostelium lacteum]|eukprot:KYQ89775.1 cytidine deaminase-like protein [Tieghemostelium lacteum]